MKDSQSKAKKGETAGNFPITIYHNPACGTSRNVLNMIRAAGYEPTVIEYLKTGWTRPQLEGLLKAMSAGPRDILRKKTAEIEKPELLNPSTSDAAILAAMIAQPVLVERPIVVTPKGTRVARPADSALDLLERKPPAG